MSQQYPQYQAPPPQQQPATPHRKPRRWVPWVSGGVVGLLAGLIVGSAGSGDATNASGGGPEPTVTVTAPGAKVTITQAPRTSAPPPAKTTPPPAAGVACVGQEDRNAPCTVTVGKAFQLGKHAVLAGWKVVSEYGSMSVTGKARNTSGEASTMFIEVKFLKADDVLAVVSCSTDELEPGQTQALKCFGTDSFTRAYDRVTAEATF